MVEYLKDFPKGPLDQYRNAASFEWKKMKRTLLSNEGILFEAKLYNELEEHPELLKYYYETPVLDKLRQNSLKKMIIIKRIEHKYINELETNGEKQLLFQRMIFGIDMSSAFKWLTACKMFVDAIKCSGTKKHLYLWEKAKDLEIFGCFGLTEVGHGSNVKGMRLTATYNVNSKEFIINSDDFLAAKCWVASLGKSATHMLTFAKLITPDGVDHGLHSFVVPIRDPQTLFVYPGIKVYDMGEKIGFNGIDNGIAVFNNYRVPYDCLLNKIADVTEDGKYVTTVEEPDKRFVFAIAELISGRIFVINASVTLLTNAVTIAIRYAAIRRQFRVKVDGEESPILEFQIHQYRLLPYLASVYAFNIFCMDVLTKINGNEHESLGLEAIEEIHAILSGFKPLSSANARDGIQECREACGGHGYLKASGLGELRNANDVFVTAEGDYHVLIQQTTKWLLKIWPKVIRKQIIITPLGSISFLNDAEDILNWRCSITSIEDVLSSKYILQTYQWLVCYLLKTCYSNLSQKTINSVYMENLAVVYTQHFVLLNMYNKIALVRDAAIKAVLLKLFFMYGIFNLLKQVPALYAGEYASGPNTVKFMDNAVMQLCADLKNEAVALVDAIGPCDGILKSVLGNSDGQVYKHLEDIIVNTPDASTRPTWWKEILDGKNTIKSKM